MVFDRAGKPPSARLTHPTGCQSAERVSARLARSSETDGTGDIVLRIAGNERPTDADTREERSVDLAEAVAAERNGRDAACNGFSRHPWRRAFCRGQCDIDPRIKFAGIFGVGDIDPRRQVAPEQSDEAIDI